MPKDPRLDSKVIELHAKLKELEHDKLVEEIRTVNNDDILGWVRYHFLSQNEMERPWQPMVINRYLERDKFFHNILPQWVAAVLSVFSLVVAILALIHFDVLEVVAHPTWTRRVDCVAVADQSSGSFWHKCSRAGCGRSLLPRTERGPRTLAQGQSRRFDRRQTTPNYPDKQTFSVSASMSPRVPANGPRGGSADLRAARYLSR
jgi:hypothetical protein